MAQFDEEALFGWVLRRCNAGSIVVPSRADRNKSAKAMLIVIKLRRSNLLNRGLQGCIAPASATPGTIGKNTIVKLKGILLEFAGDESGATAIEYGLIAAGIALAIIEVIYALGTNLVEKLQALATALK
jgi:Flp pilus assembly pilin Flp